MHVLDTRQLRTGKSEDRGLVLLVFVFCVTFLLQDEPKLPPDEKGLDARALGGTCSRSGRSARRAGPKRCRCACHPLQTHSTYVFHFSLCQRNYEQARLVHLIVIAVPVPQIQEQIFDVIKVIPEEWMSKRTVQQIVDGPVPQIPEQIVEVISDF